MEHFQNFATARRAFDQTGVAAARPARSAAHIVLRDVRTCQALAALLMIEGFSVSFSNDDEALDDIRIDNASVLIVGKGRLLDSLVEADRDEVGCGLVVIADDLQTDDVVNAMRAGAQDVLSLPVDASRFLSSVKEAISSPSMRGRGTHLPEALSPREEEVLHLVARGLLSKQIADRLGISPRTVENHRSRIRHKLGARNPADSLQRLWAAKGGRP